MSQEYLGKFKKLFKMFFSATMMPFGLLKAIGIE
jgi:hypothetical protein